MLCDVMVPRGFLLRSALVARIGLSSTKLWFLSLNNIREVNIPHPCSPPGGTVNRGRRVSEFRYTLKNPQVGSIIRSSTLQHRSMQCLLGDVKHQTIIHVELFECVVGMASFYVLLAEGMGGGGGVGFRRTIAVAPCSQGTPF